MAQTIRMKGEYRADARVGEILIQLDRFSEGVFSHHLATTEHVCETNRICEGINSLGEVLAARAEFIKHKEERINKILDVLLRYTVMDFSEKAGISPLGDEIDALAAGLNAMAEEVIYHHAQLKDSEEKIRLLNASLEQRVVDRTEALQESENKYRNLFENNPVPLWVLDASTLRFLDVNESAVRQYGYSHEEFLSMSAVDIRPQEEKKRFLELHRDLIGTQKAGVWKHLKKDGTIISVDVTVHSIIFDSTPARMVLALDVTERERMQQAILELNQALEQRVAQRTEELQLVNKELEAFSYSVSHDLRAPLRAVHSYSQIMVEDYESKLDGEGIRILNLVKSNARKMGQLVDDLLSFARMGKKELAITEVDINRIVDEVLKEMVSDSKTLAKITVQPLSRARADSALLRQVFQNLISNAIKYSSKKKNPSIEIGMREINGLPTYFVKDNGAGFDMTYYDKLFGVFQRLHSQDEFDGTGVGLALVHRIITRHGGKVWAEGMVCKGATFYFTLNYLH